MKKKKQRKETKKTNKQKLSHVVTVVGFFFYFEIVFPHLFSLSIAFIIFIFCSSFYPTNFDRAVISLSLFLSFPLSFVTKTLFSHLAFTFTPSSSPLPALFFLC